MRACCVSRPLSGCLLGAAQALGWLVMLLPTQQAARRDGDWDAWLREWLRLWGEVYHSAFWNTLWLHLVARLAKHDTAGAPPARRGCACAEGRGMGV